MALREWGHHCDSEKVKTVSKDDARDIAARKLCQIYDSVPTGSERELEAIRALGGTGSAIAAEKLRAIYNSVPTNSRREKEAIRAMGEIGRAP